MARKQYNTRRRKNVSKNLHSLVKKVVARNKWKKAVHRWRVKRPIYSAQRSPGWYKQQQRNRRVSYLKRKFKSYRRSPQY